MGRPWVGAQELWPWLPIEVDHAGLTDFIYAIPHFVLSGLGLSGSWVPLRRSASVKEAFTHWFAVRGVGNAIKKPEGLNVLSKRLRAIQKAALRLSDEILQDNRGHVERLKADIGGQLQTLNTDPDLCLVYWAIWGCVFLAPVSTAAGHQQFTFVADSALQPTCDLPAPYMVEADCSLWAGALVREPKRLLVALDAALSATEAVEAQLRRFGSPGTKKTTNARQANLAILEWGEARGMGPYAVARAIYDFVNGGGLHWVEQDRSRQWLGIQALNTPADAVNHILETWLDITTLIAEGLVKKRA